jgi:hypothetical protein
VQSGHEQRDEQRGDADNDEQLDERESNWTASCAHGGPRRDRRT